MFCLRRDIWIFGGGVVEREWRGLSDETRFAAISGIV